MPNAKAVNVVPNTRRSNDVPNIRIEKGVRLAAVTTTHSAGEAIGLLLALTYAAEVIDTAYSEGNIIPNVRIK